MTLRSATLALLVSALAGTHATAQEASSVYTGLDLGKCLILTTEEEAEENQGAEWVCEGHNRVVVWIAEGDLRYFLGYGSRGRDQCGYRQTLAPFHTVHTTLEWRLKGGEPVATILRYFIDMDGQKSQHLVVTKLGDGEACHMAVVDASQPNANALARQAADQYAEDFDCETDQPFYFSAQGQSTNGPLGISQCPPEE